MNKHHAFDEVMAPLRAYNWKELPPSEQRALFTQLTGILLAMMEQDQLPDDRLRITNADRERRTGENEDKLALLRTSFETLFYEMLNEDQFRELLAFFRMAALTVKEISLH